MDNFDRDFNIMRRFIMCFIAFVGLLWTVGFGLQAYLAVKAVSTVTEECHDGLAKCAGRVYGDFKKGAGE